MRRSHREMQTSKSKPRKFNGKCECCGKTICSCKAYQYVDESNASITNNSPYLCKECCEKKYGLTIKTDVEKYKERLIDKFMYLSDLIEFDSLENIIKIIKLTE